MSVTAPATQETGELTTFLWRHMSVTVLKLLLKNKALQHGKLPPTIQRYFLQNSSGTANLIHSREATSTPGIVIPVYRFYHIRETDRHCTSTSSPDYLDFILA